MNRKCTWLVISSVLLKLKDFFKSLTVTYTVIVVISQQRCKIVHCYYCPLIRSDLWPIE